jgi:hypothetical protein
MDRERLIAVAEKVAALVAQRERIESELDALLGSGPRARIGRPAKSVAKVIAKSARRDASPLKGRKRGLQKGSLGFRIVAAVQKSGRPMNAQLVSSAIGEKRVTHVSSTMNRLKATGYLKRVGRGKYRGA